MTFSLAAELADAYRNGISAGKETAADEEVRVLLYSKHPSGRVSEGLVEAIQDSLQQAHCQQPGFHLCCKPEGFWPGLQPD